MQYGIVKWYNEGQGRGVIVSDEGLKEVLVTHSAITGEGFKVLNEGQRVRFDIVETARGAAAANGSSCARTAPSTSTASGTPAGCGRRCSRSAC